MTKTSITFYGCTPDETVLLQNMAPRFGIIPTITNVPVSGDSVELARGNRCISVSHRTHITNATLQALSDAGVEYISTRSAGYNHIDVDFARSVGITVGNVAYSPDSVADYTLMLMLMAVRHAKSIILRTDAQDYRLHDARGKELRDMTIGVIGTGRIGSAVIDRLQGFGCHILAYDHHPKSFATHASLNELLSQSDIITLHTPLNTDTFHLLNHQRIQQMKHGAYVVNTGRGPLIDTVALIAALKSGKLGGAALDVLEEEEGIFYTNQKNNPIKNELLVHLQKMPNVLITPHTAYYTDHALSDMAEASITNCLEFEKENHYE